MKVRLILLLLVASLLRGIIVKAQDPNAPYLFYFDPNLHSFVFERADGHDYRLFLAGQIPEHLNVAYWSWSPDYTQLAFSLGFNRSIETIWLADSAGNIINRIEATNAAFEWAPQNRYLLIKECLTVWCGDEGSHRISLFDVHSNRIVNQYEQSPYDDSDAVWQDGLSNTSWSDNGNQFVFTERVYLPAGFGSQTIVMDVDGTIETRLTEWAGQLLPDGHLAYVESIGNQNYLVLEDLTTTDLNRYPLGNQRYPQIFLRPSGIVVVTQRGHNSANQPQRTIWQLDLDTPSPQRVNLQRYAGAITVLPSPDETHLLYQDLDGVYQVLVLDTMQATALDFLTDSDIYLGWRWHSNTILSNTTQYPVTTTFYDITTNTWLAGEGWHENYSPDLSYGVVSLRSPALISNLTDNTTVTIPPHSRLVLMGTKDIITRWHPEAPWLIMGESIFVAGGGPGPYVYTILRADGAFRREYANRSWLPIDLDPDAFDTIPYQPDPPSLQPILVLQTNHRNRALYWHPEGTHIAMDTNMSVGYGNLSTGPYHVWEVENNAESIVFAEQPQPVQFEWTVRYDGNYSPSFRVVEENDIVLWSPDRRYYLAPNGNAGGLYTYDATTDTAIASVIDNLYWSNIGQHPRLNILAMATARHGIQFYDIMTGHILMELPIHADAVAFSPDGELLAVSTSWELHIYRLDDILQVAQ